jgi:3-oxoacyl-[acyl-carrier protein] reductase
MSAHRTAVVIGAASGIGWASARALAAENHRVVVADRNADGARDRAGELGDPHSAAAVDVTDEASVQQLFDAIGPLDVVVNCAGLSNFGLITDMPVDQFRAVVDLASPADSSSPSTRADSCATVVCWCRPRHSTAGNRRRG